MKDSTVKTKQNLDLNLYFIEQTLYSFDNLNLSEEIKRKIRELNSFIYKKLYKDIKGKDIVKEKAVLITYYKK